MTTERKTISLSLGNRDNADNFIVLNGVKLNLTGVTYFALEVKAGEAIDWIIRTKNKIDFDEEKNNPDNIVIGKQ
jgi:hypothetical protein